jgi:REP element-mobilizing transposase RayT
MQIGNIAKSHNIGNLICLKILLSHELFSIFFDSVNRKSHPLILPSVCFGHVHVLWKIMGQLDEYKRLNLSIKIYGGFFGNNEFIHVMWFKVGAS